MCEKLKGRFPRLQRNEVPLLIWADGAYSAVVEWVGSFAGWVLEIVKRPDAAKGFVLLPRRWVVERTFAWLIWSARISRLGSSAASAEITRRRAKAARRGYALP